MTEEVKLNRRTRRLLERGYVMPQGEPTLYSPIDRARCLRHKKPYQHKQAEKARAVHGC